MDFLVFINKLKGLPEFCQKEADKIVKTEFDYIKKMNQERMYNEGKGADGVTFGDYRPFTVEMKRMNRPGHDSKISNITLKDTGSFYESIELKIKELNVIEIKGTSDTAEILVRKPQFKEALGLTEQEANFMSQMLAEKLSQSIVNYLK